MLKKSRAIVFLSLVLGGVWAVGQETTGVISGTVRSPDGARLVGVTVAIDSPDNGLQRSDVSDFEGEYLFAALPPGRYRMTATLEGFKTYRRELEVNLGRTMMINFEMVPGAITDLIEPTADSPLVDVTNTVTGITVNAGELFSYVPLVRDTQRIALLAPTAVAGDSAFNGSYVGAGTYDQVLVSIGGASVAENSYQVNGLNITNFRTGVGSSWVPFDFVDEVQVKTGGYEAELGRATGGVINMVTKSGANSLHGGVNLFFEPESLQENEPDTPWAYNQQDEREVLEANASLGGPIFRDKLFFFGFVQFRDTDYLTTTTTTATRERGAEPYYGAKIDWNMTTSHRLELTYLNDETDIERFLYPLVDGVPDETDLVSDGTQRRGGENYIFKYTGIFTENFLISAQYGANNFDRTDTATGDVFPYAHNYTSGHYERFPGWTNRVRGYSSDEREAYRLDADLYLSNHSLRGGIDYENNWSSDNLEYSGGYRISYFLNNGRFPDLPWDQMIADYRIYRSGGDFDVYSNAIYVQDSWAVTPNLTVNLGVRWEQYENENINGETFIKINDQYAPRLGIIWDPSGEGRSKLYGSYGRYHLPIASNTNIRMAGVELYVADWYTVDGYNPDGSPINMDTTNPLDDQRVYADGIVPDVREVAAENLEPMSQDELIVGYEQIVGDNWTVGVHAVARDFTTVIEDISGDWALYNIEAIDIDRWWGILANPGNDVIAWVDTDGDGEVERFHFTAAELGYPEAGRKYYAVELSATRRFADSWMAFLSYTWSHSYGNYEGYVDSTYGCGSGGVGHVFDYPGLTDHSRGNLPNDRRHSFKAFGVYAFDNGLQLGGNFFFQSGRPISGLGIYPDPDNPASNYGVASFFVQGEPAPRGSFGTTDEVWALDAMVKYDLALGLGQLSLRLDVFNVFNNDSVTEVYESGDLSSGAVNPDFLAASHYQAPRTVRLGVGFVF